MRVGSRRRLAGAAVAAVSAGMLWPLAAYGLVVSASDVEQDYFAGSACGSTSTATSYLPLGARRIEPQRPEIGAALRDENTGAIVARVTGVRVQRAASGRPVVRYTAAGSDDVCTNPGAYADLGWETRFARFSVSYERRVRVYGASCYTARYRPRSFILACGDGNRQLRGVRWARWDGKVARGRGVSFENDCMPYCAVGQFHSYPVTVRASRPKRQECNGRVRYIYQRLQVTYTGDRPPHAPRSYRWPWGCLSTDV
jgi:hypothetical protein